VDKTVERAFGVAGPEGQIVMVDPDEMHTYVDRKNYCWIWIAVDRYG
jgi:hypothetical protein